MAAATPDASSSLARYVPRQSAEWDLSTTELWQEIDGTLCYIDLSGFTALSEKLARRGRIGAEELTEALNYVFAKMLGVAYDRGGSLLKFGGDALLLVFTGSDHPIQACSAAVEMQAVLREARSHETSAGRLHLKMSVGLHSGTIHLFRVGESHKELILTGPAASMTTELEETAVAGEILISSATKAALPAGSVKRKKDRGWLLGWRKARIECCGWSPRIVLEPDAVAAGMPVALRDHLQYGAAEPEHHLATVAFVRFEGVDALMGHEGPRAVAESLDELIRNLQEAVDEEGVTFLASDIDQDGGKLIIVAGVPGVQEDDEGRVLRAARRIVDRAGSLPLRVGINRGHVFAGEIGSDFRATYTIMGDTVNLAARLMAAASPGEVYASPSVLDGSLTLFETSPLDPFYVKGKEHPVQVYAVGAETGNRPSRRGGDLPFAGRVEELAELTGLLDGLSNGTGGVVSVIGERGIGKSRLVDEALAAWKEPTVRLTIRAEPYGTATPFRAIRDAVRTLLGVERSTHPKMAEQLRAGIEDLRPDLVPLLPLIAEAAMVEVPMTPEAEATEPRFRMDRTADMLVDLLSAALTGPVLFAVEDGHWMDEASAHLLTRIAERCGESPWMILLTRHDDLTGFSPPGRAFQLQPLTDEDARALVVEATAGAPLRPHDLEAILERAEGLPLFLEEIVRAVRQAGGTESLPDSLDAIVSAQIDGLAPLARRLLRFASVLGRSFRVDTLNDLVADEQVALDAATQSQLAGFLEFDGSDRMRFRHALLRDAAYEGLSFRRRQELHLRAGQVIERHAGRDPEAVADILALHYARAGEHERTWRFARVAGDEAMAAYANVEAAVQYERALDAARRLPELADDEVRPIWTRLGDVYEEAGLFVEALEAFRRASRLTTDPVAEADLVLRRARARARAGAYRAALSESTRGLRLLAEIDGTAAAGARARLTSFSGVIRQTQQHPEEALALAKQAAAAAEDSGELEALARAYEVMDWAFRMLGRADEATHADQSLALRRAIGDSSGAAIVINNMGAEAYFSGQWDRAVELYAEARAALLEAGNAVQAANAAANIAEVRIDQGRFEEAEPILEEAVRVLRASDFRDAAMFAEVQHGRLLVRQQRIDEAVGELEAVLAEATELGHQGMVLQAALTLAGAKVRSDEPQAGREILDQAEERSPDAVPFFRAGIARVRASALMTQGEWGPAAEEVRRGQAHAEQHDLPYEQALLTMLSFEIAHRAGWEPDQAALDEATTTLTGLGVPSSAVSVLLPGHFQP